MNINSPCVNKYLNPDWKLAKLHSRSVKPGYVINNQNYQICECCFNIVPQQKVPFLTHAKQLQFLGFGFPLWYTFLKYCSILLLMLISSYCIESIYHAVNHNKQFCKDYYWGNDIVNKHQVGNKVGHEGGNQGESLYQNNQHKNLQHNLLKTRHYNQHAIKCTGIFILLSRINTEISEFDSLFRVTSFIITLLTLAFMRDNLYKTEQYYDERRCSNADYSIIISKIPKIQGIQSKFKKFFSQMYVPALHVEQIILIPEYQELVAIQHNKQLKIKQLQHYVKDDEHQHQQQIDQICKDLSLLDGQEQQEIQIFKKQMMLDKLACERVIIILNTQHEKQTALQEFQDIKDNQEQLIKYFGPGGQLIRMDEAPEPREIIWQNINYPASKRLLRIGLGWGLSSLFILLTTLIFYLILKWKTHLAEQEKYVKYAAFIVYTAILLVILFNKFVMGTVLHHLTDLEKHATADRYQFSFAFKYALGMFFTTALMTLFVQAFTYNNFYTHAYGVIEQQSIMFFMNSLLVPLIWLINPFQIMVLIKRYISYGKKHLTQKEANHVMEDFQYDIGKRYAEILESIWFTFLYASLIPLGAFLALIGIGLYYWVDKYNLLRRSSVHENISGKLTLIAMKLLDAVLIFLPLGEIIFDSSLRKQVNKSSIICLILGIIYLILPINQILDFISEQKFNLQQKQYRDVKHTFKDQYYDLHPIYKKTHSQYNKESRIKYKDQIIRKFSKPIYSFMQGWLTKGKQ